MKRLGSILIIIISLSLCKEDNSRLFVDYIRQFEESVQKLDQKNGIIYTDYDYLFFDYPAKIEPWHKKVYIVKNNKNKLLHLIDSIQLCTDTIIIKKIRKHDVLRSYQLNKKVRAKNGDIDQIQLSIFEYKKNIISLIKDTVKYNVLIKKINETLSSYHLNTLNAFNTHLVSTVELLACFSKLKLDITIAETNILTYLQNQVDFNSFTFRNIEAFVVPNSLTILSGTQYRAEIFLAVYDTTSNPLYEIDGQKHETASGIGIYTHKITEKPGIYSKNGNFVVKSPVNGEIRKYPFKIEYEVLE